MKELFNLEKTVEQVGEEIAGDLSSEERNEMMEAIKQHLTTGIPPLQALGFSTEMVDALYTIGHQLYKAQKYDQAARIFQVMARLDPNNFRAYFGQAICAHKQEKYTVALLHYFTAINYEQEDPLPWYHLAHCFHELKRDDDAKIMLRRAIILAKKDEKKHGSLGERALLWLKALNRGVIKKKKKKKVTKG